jgi:transposase
MLVNARHVKQVPGRKTDVTDCDWLRQPDWLCQLLEHGLLKASFVPGRPRRELRDLTRQRTQLLGDRARVVNRIQKTLEDANIKLAGLRRHRHHREERAGDPRRPGGGEAAP